MGLILQLTQWHAVDDQAVLVAAVYLSRLLEHRPVPVSSCTVHRLLLVAVVVALKFLHDKSPCNKVMAEAAGVSTAELNKLGVKLLCDIGYDLRVSVADM